MEFNNQNNGNSTDNWNQQSANNNTPRGQHNNFNIPKLPNGNRGGIKKIVIAMVCLLVLVVILLVAISLAKPKDKVQDTTEQEVNQQLTSEPLKEDIEDYNVGGVLSLEERDKERKYYTHKDEFLNLEFTLPDNYFLHEKTHLSLSELETEEGEDLTTSKFNLEEENIPAIIPVFELESKNYQGVSIYFQLNHLKDYPQEDEITNSTNTYIGRTIEYYNAYTAKEKKELVAKDSKLKKESAKANKIINAKTELPTDIQNVSEHRVSTAPYDLKQETTESVLSDGSKLERTILEYGFGGSTVITKQSWSKPEKLVMQSEYTYIPFYLAVELPSGLTQVNDYSSNACPTEVDFIDEVDAKENTKFCYNYSGKVYYNDKKKEEQVVEEDTELINLEDTEEIVDVQSPIGESEGVETATEDNVEMTEEELLTGTFTTTDHPKLNELATRLTNSEYTVGLNTVKSKRVDLLKNNTEEYLAYELSINIGASTLYVVVVSQDIQELYYVMQDIENIMGSVKLVASTGNADVNEDEVTPTLKANIDDTLE